MHHLLPLAVKDQSNHCEIEKLQATLAKMLGELTSFSRTLAGPSPLAAASAEFLTRGRSLLLPASAPPAPMIAASVCLGSLWKAYFPSHLKNGPRLSWRWQKVGVAGNKKGKSEIGSPTISIFRLNFWLGIVRFYKENIGWCLTSVTWVALCFWRSPQAKDSVLWEPADVCSATQP